MRETRENQRGRKEDKETRGTVGESFGREPERGEMHERNSG